MYYIPDILRCFAQNNGLFFVSNNMCLSSGILNKKPPTCRNSGGHKLITMSNSVLIDLSVYLRVWNSYLSVVCWYISCMDAIPLSGSTLPVTKEEFPSNHNVSSLVELIKDKNSRYVLIIDPKFLFLISPLHTSPATIDWNYLWMAGVL